MKKQFAVLGLGKFGLALALELENLGHQVLAVDRNADVVNACAHCFTYCLQADCTEEQVLGELGLRNFDTVVIGFSEIQASAIVALSLKEMGIPYVVAKSTGSVHTRLLKKIGVDRIVFPEHDMGERIARSLTSSNVLEMIDVSEDYGIVEFEPLTEWLGKTLKDLNIRRRYGVNVIAVKSQSGKLDVSPNPDAPIQAGDLLILIGQTHALDKFVQKN